MAAPHARADAGSLSDAAARPARFVVGISGASGVRYGLRLVQVLLDHPNGYQVHLIPSRGAAAVAHHEEALELRSHLDHLVQRHGERLLVYDDSDLAASPASGSFLHDGMLVVPSSLKTTARIAHGIADSLIARSAMVCLKEGRPLVFMPRETPLDLITLRNWVTLKEAGARLVPAMPGFYHRPTSIDDLVDHLVGKLLDQVGVPHALYQRWERPPRVDGREGKVAEDRSQTGSSN